MPLDPEFKKHLRSLMVEVSEKTSAETQEYRRQRIWNAQQTHNSAAMPIAYMDAALHSIETRVGKTIEKYIEAVSIWGLDINPAFEKEMINEFIMLTAGPNQIQFPPAIRGHQVQAVQGSFARERAKLANRLVREGTNRLCELKMKMKRPIQSTSITNFNAPVGKVYSDSVSIGQQLHSHSANS